jgi:NADPH2:quinone reductase
VVPASQTASLPEGVSFEQGACLGIPAITAHRCVHAAGPVEGRTVLVQAAPVQSGFALSNSPVVQARP